MSSGRDNFNARTKSDLSLRASHICSNCKCSTSGPSDEGPNAVVNIGVAAHICAAAKGGRRYDPHMTSEQRRHIDNGIWLCASCSILIDRDAQYYSVIKLRDVKREHEASRRISGAHHIDSADIIAIGPDIIAAGRIISSGQSSLKVRLVHFVEGSGRDLLMYSNEYDHCSANKRYIVINELGYGGALAVAPNVTHYGNNYEVEFGFVDRVPRRDATRRLVSMCAETGEIIEDMDALIQHFESTLGTVRGESFADLELGSYLADFYWRYQGSPWFEALAKMEIARLCSVPKLNHISNKQTTPLLSVNRVDRVTVPTFALDHQKLRLEVEFDIEGAGPWTGELAIFIASSEQIIEARERGARHATNISRIESESIG